MPTDLKIHSNFFFELGTTPPLGGGYGPTGATNSEKENAFQTTAYFTNSNTVKAVAVLDSHVLIVPQVDENGVITNKVNLILKPSQVSNSPLSIRYFVYRGIARESFVETGNNTLILHDNLQNNKLVERLWSRLKQFYYNGITNPDVSNDQIEAKDVGYFISLTDHSADTLIDSFFDYTLTDIYNLPQVKQGDWIGDFSGDFGLDIVLNNGVYEETGFKLDLNYARKIMWRMDVSAASGVSGFLEKAYRENIRLFIDPAAFWGLHDDNGSEKGIFLYPNNPVDNPNNYLPDINGTVYSKVLSLFDTKHTVYIDIQSEGARSYDYYNSYNESDTSNLDVIFGNTTTTADKRRYAAFKWPTLIFNGFQSNALAYNSIYLLLFQKKNATALLYAEVGDLLGFSDVRNTNNAIKVIASQETAAFFAMETYYDFANIAIGSDKYCQASFRKLIYKNTYDPLDSDGVTEDNEKIFYSRNILAGIFSFDEFSSSRIFDQDPHTIEVKVNKSPGICSYSLQDGVSKDLLAGVETVMVKDVYTDTTGTPKTRFQFRLNNLVFCDHSLGRSNKKTLSEESLNNYSDHYDKECDNSFGFGKYEYRTFPIDFQGKRYQLPAFKQGTHNILIGIDSANCIKLMRIKSEKQLTNVFLYLNLRDYATRLRYNDKNYYRIAYLTISGENSNGEMIVVHDPEDSIVLVTFDEFLFATWDFLGTIKEYSPESEDTKFRSGKRAPDKK